jgi:16S rRNA (guanine(527)-N(7))-methyltransferase RsmG
MEQYFQDPKDQIVWNKFVQTYTLDEVKQDKFKKYLDLIIQENQKYNITAITSNQGIIFDHFYDSLALQHLVEMDKVSAIADVGSGGGFPGIPLAILNDHITFHLVEVTLKKVQFLQMVADALGLKNIIIHTDDWRTFLRTFHEPINIFTARASLQLKELFRIFKPSSQYQQSLLVYWASKNWVTTEQESEYLDSCEEYQVGEKKRSLCFFKNE